MVMVLCIAPVSYGGKANDTLEVVVDELPENFDGYYNGHRIGILITRCLWDSLLYRDPDTWKYEPLLATSYRWVDKLTMEFELRKGVKFHDGSEFDADDVVYTMNFVSDPTNGVKTQRNVNWIKKAEKLDKYKVKVHLKKVFPAALEYVAGMVPIYPSDYYAKVGPTGMGLKPVGTGPYMAVSVNPGTKLVMKKYEDYYMGEHKPKANIGNLTLRLVPEMNTQIAELMAGRAGWLWRVPPDQAEKLARMKKITVKNGMTMRIGYLAMDASNKTGKNPPTTKLKVRQALAHAIDRETIVKTLIRGQSEVIHSACFPTQFGCTKDLTKYEYNPEKAKKLLAEAGYPNGFSIDFYGYRDRPSLEAIINYWKAVGIKANLVYQKYPAVRDGLRGGKVALVNLTWGSYSINDVSAITSHFFKLGADDLARDEQVKEWLDIADNSVDTKVREENYKKALQRIAAQCYWIPTWSYNFNFAYDADLDFTPTPDEISRFFLMKWK
jgi:peptide/nickel transport system substrate-binding protein